MQTTVIGIGSRTGTDDQIGLEIVESVGGQKEAIPQTVFEIWDRPDTATVAGNLLELAGPVVFVDAADMGLDPGEYRVFDGNGAAIQGKAPSISTHGMGLADGIILARELGFDHPIMIFGVQPFDVSVGLGLSPEMRVRLPYLESALLDRLNVSEHSETRDRDAVPMSSPPATKEKQGPPSGSRTGGSG